MVLKSKVGLISLGVVFFAISGSISAQERTVPERQPNLEPRTTSEEVGEEFVEDVKSLPERAAGWVLTLPARFYNASVGLHERSDNYSSTALSDQIDKALENLRSILANESQQENPDYTAIRTALAGAVATMDQLDQLYRDIQYYENWDDAALVVEWLSFLGASRAALVGLGTKIKRKKDAEVVVTRRGKAGFWSFAILWGATLAVDKLYIEEKIEDLKRVYSRQLLNTARLVQNLILVDEMLMSKGEASVLAEFPQLDLEALRYRLETDYAFLQDLENEVAPEAEPVPVEGSINPEPND